MKLDIPNFATQKELHAFLVENKASLMAQKKSAIKEADAFGGFEVMKDQKGRAYKANEPIPDYKNLEFINVKAVINTTGILDSHRDVHIKGIWNRTVKNNKYPLHVQEHKSSQFDKIIADGNDLNQSVKTYTWKELGFDYKGTTEALLFTSKVRKDRNPYMFDLYAQGKVRNHSVGMQYVRLELCVNDENWAEEYENWKTYEKEIVNKEDMEGVSYFWAVLEAKAIEGSAVPLGSNFATPTEDNNAKTHENTFGKANSGSLERTRREFFNNLI